MENNEIVEELAVTAIDKRRVRRATLIGLALVIADGYLSRYLDTHNDVYAGDVDTVFTGMVTAVTAVAGLSWYILARRTRHLNSAIIADDNLNTNGFGETTIYADEPLPTYDPPIEPPQT